MQGRRRIVSGTDLIGQASSLWKKLDGGFWTEGSLGEDCGGAGGGCSIEGADREAEDVSFMAVHITATNMHVYGSCGIIKLED